MPSSAAMRRACVRRLDVGERDDAALGLRDDLLADDEVRRREREARALAPRREQGGEVVARLDRGDARQRQEPDRGGRLAHRVAPASSSRSSARVRGPPVALLRKASRSSGSSRSMAREGSAQLAELDAGALGQLAVDLRAARAEARRDHVARARAAAPTVPPSSRGRERHAARRRSARAASRRPRRGRPPRRRARPGRRPAGPAANSAAGRLDGRVEAGFGAQRAPRRRPPGPPRPRRRRASPRPRAPRPGTASSVVQHVAQHRQAASARGAFGARAAEAAATSTRSSAFTGTTAAIIAASAASSSTASASRVAALVVTHDRVDGAGAQARGPRCRRRSRRRARRGRSPRPARGRAGPRRAPRPRRRCPRSSAIRRALQRRAAHDRRDRDDRRAALARAPRARRAAPGSGRSRRPGCSGRQTIVRAPRSASSTPGPGLALRGRRQVDALHVVGRAVAHQVLLEVDATAAAELDERRAGILGHREDARRHAERAANLVGDLGEPGPGGEPQRAVLAGGEVAVAEPEPGLVAQRAERLDQREAVALEAVAALAVDADPRACRSRCRDPARRGRRRRRDRRRC